MKKQIKIKIDDPFWFKKGYNFSKNIINNEKIIPNKNYSKEKDQNEKKINERIQFLKNDEEYEE